MSQLNLDVQSRTAQIERLEQQRVEEHNRASREKEIKEEALRQAAAEASRHAEAGRVSQEQQALQHAKVKELEEWVKAQTKEAKDPPPQRYSIETTSSFPKCLSSLNCS